MMYICDPVDPHVGIGVDADLEGFHLAMMIMSSIIMMFEIINDDSDNCGGDEAENDINDEKGSEAQR